MGVLVPLSYGRLGRSWLHAEELRDLAAYVDGASWDGDARLTELDRLTVDDTENTDALNDYWEAHRLDSGEEPRPTSSTSTRKDTPAQNKRRKRALSDATGIGPDAHTLSPDHPAISLANDLDTFGPLLFPLYRAALVRRRILVLTSPPIQRTCNFGTRSQSLTRNLRLTLV